MHPCDIRVGTSGWRFEDWAGSFYPLRVPKSQWLEYYAARFSVGEVNSTYYRIPSVRSFVAMADKTPQDFQFLVKVHGDVTHVRRNPHDSMKALQTAVSPLKTAGKLSGFLSQFPAGFRFDSKNLDYVRGLTELLEGVRLCVEFRHVSWDNPEAKAAIQEAQMTWVAADEPEIKHLMPRTMILTGDTFYLRLHGRNAETWYDHSAGDRYDYDYSDDELRDVGQAVTEAARHAKQAFVLFNNCYAGQAPRNAWWLKTWLEALEGANDD